MSMSLLSKIRRKLAWELRQTIAAPARLANFLFANSYHDLILSRRRKTTDGDVRRTSRIAIVLIFPRFGVEPSHVRTLRYLVEKGYAPVVVSNIHLSDLDRITVTKTCWRLIERPNFGYDFGGYRDGILSLGDDLGQLERLVLLNDSCWFPLPASSDWLDDAAALNVDFAGAASNYGVTPQKVGCYEYPVWSYRSDNPDFHYCSFALLISGALLHDPRFRRFWKRFPLSNDKYQVIRRGEVGLTQWVLRHGFSHGSTLDITHLDAELNTCSVTRLLRIVQQLIIPEEAELRIAKSSLVARYDASENWRKDAVGFILTAVAQTGVAYVLPEYTVRDRGFPFLKKSPLWLDEDSAESTLEIARGLDGAEGAQILAEARELRVRGRKAVQSAL